MCTLAVAFRPQEAFPLVVAANRDERLDRAASPPRLWPGAVPFVAPRDEVAHGTWLGLNARGLFVGITNRFGASADGARESRGTLVTEALVQPGATALHRALADLPARRFNAFHLLYADREAAYVTWSDGAVVRHEVLPPGLHVVTERSLGGDDRSRGEWVRAGYAELGARHPPAPEVLQRLLSSHGEEPLGGTCIHVPAFNYGTRSSMVLFLARGWAETRLWWAEGPPCRTPYVELPEWVRALDAASRPEP